MTTDRLFGLIAAALAAAFLLFGVPTISDDWLRAAGARYFTVGPRLFPYVAGALCLLFACAIALRPQPVPPRIVFADGGARRRVLLLMLLVLAYAGLLDALGFVLASSAMLLVFMLGFGIRRWTVVLPVALALPMLTEMLFRRVLFLFLPPGPFEPPF